MRQPLDCDDLGVIGLHRILRAASHGSAVDEHSAGAAHAMLAADVNTIRIELVPEKVA